MPLIRQHVYYSGHVQGVGFRYNALGCARAYAVTGMVRNLDDGRVEMVVEGSTDEVRALLDDIQDRMRGYILETESRRTSPTGEYGDFSIAR